MRVDQFGRFSGGAVSCNGGKIHVYTVDFTVIAEKNRSWYVTNGDNRW
jgi:hypothetical protein